MNLSTRIPSERVPLVFVSSRGLFAGHYTETHYLADGSAVSSSHNSTVGCPALSVLFSVFS